MNSPNPPAERMAEVLRKHREELHEEGVCICGWHANAELDWPAHVADAVVAALGLTEETVIVDRDTVATALAYGVWFRTPAAAAARVRLREAAGMRAESAAEPSPPTDTGKVGFVAPGATQRAETYTQSGLDEFAADTSHNPGDSQ